MTDKYYAKEHLIGATDGASHPSHFLPHTTDPYQFDDNKDIVGGTTEMNRPKEIWKSGDEVSVIAMSLPSEHSPQVKEIWRRGDEVEEMPSTLHKPVENKTFDCNSGDEEFPLTIVEPISNFSSIDGQKENSIDDDVKALNSDLQAIENPFVNSEDLLKPDVKCNDTLSVAGLKEVSTEGDIKKNIKELHSEPQGIKIPCVISEDSLKPEVKCNDIPLKPEVKCNDIPLKPEVKCNDIPLKPEVKCNDIPLKPEVKCNDIPLKSEVKCNDIPLKPEVKCNDIPLSTKSGVSIKDKVLPTKNSTSLPTSTSQKDLDLKNKSVPQSVNSKDKISAPVKRPETIVMKPIGNTNIKISSYEPLDTSEQTFNQKKYDGFHNNNNENKTFQSEMKKQKVKDKGSLKPNNNSGPKSAKKNRPLSNRNSCDTKREKQKNDVKGKCGDAAKYLNVEKQLGLMFGDHCRDENKIANIAFNNSYYNYLSQISEKKRKTMLNKIKKSKILQDLIEIFGYDETLVKSIRLKDNKPRAKKPNAPKANFEHFIPNKVTKSEKKKPEKRLVKPKPKLAPKRANNRKTKSHVPSMEDDLDDLYFKRQEESTYRRNGKNGANLVKVIIGKPKREATDLTLIVPKRNPPKRKAAPKKIKVLEEGFDDVENEVQNDSPSVTSDKTGEYSNISSVDSTADEDGNESKKPRLELSPPPPPLPTPPADDFEFVHINKLQEFCLEGHKLDMFKASVNVATGQITVFCDSCQKKIVMDCNKD